MIQNIFVEVLLFCAPDETTIALQALAQNNAVYEKCMMSKGYVPQ